MSLTPRQREVLDLIAEGLSNRQIADALVVDERTVRSHVNRILADLHVANRTAAAATVWRRRLDEAQQHAHSYEIRWHDMERYARMVAKEIR